MLSLKQELTQRGFLYQCSNEAVFDIFEQGGEKFYCGFDPTAESLHLGNFIGFMCALHIMRRGNTFIALTGGATGMIGDPGGKDSERNFIDQDTLANNAAKIQKQMQQITKNLENYLDESLEIQFVNNKDFYTDMGYLDFLREFGKYITINVMMSKDTVKKRIEDPKQSISYTEFSYMLLQGYDFSKMFIEDGVSLQIGGQDQWGNLVTGTEIIRKKYEKDSYALTWPLITDASGKKFGKSEGNALFLDKEKTQPYEIYQYFMNTRDEDLEKYFNILTFFDSASITEILSAHGKNPEKRQGQKRLAFEIVAIIHGKTEAELCEKITAFLFEDEDKLTTLSQLSEQERETFRQATGGFKYTDQNLFTAMVEAGLTKSNSESRQAVQSGAVSINQEKITDPKIDFSSLFVNDSFILLQKGKKNLRVITK